MSTPQFQVGISRRRLAIGAAWTAPAVMMAAAAPSMAASPPPPANCPTLSNTAGCDWNYNGSDASAYFVNNRFTQNISATGGSYPAIGEWSGTENNYKFAIKLTVVYPSTAVLTDTVDVGGIWAGTASSATTLTAALPAATPDGFTGSFQTRTVTVTWTETSCCTSDICAGIGLNFTGLSTTQTQGSQVLVTTSTNTAGVPCTPVPGSSVPYKFSSFAASTAPPYNADGLSSGNPVWRKPAITNVVVSGSGSVPRDGGGRTLTINGTGFDAATSVKVGSVTVTNFTVVNNYQITLTLPPQGSAGPKCVQVIGTFGSSAVTTGTNCVTYL